MILKFTVCYTCCSAISFGYGSQTSHYVLHVNSTFIFLENHISSNIISNKFNFIQEENYPIKWIDFIVEDNIPTILESNNIFYNKNKITNESIRLKNISNNSLNISNNLCLGYEIVNIYDNS